MGDSLLHETKIHGTVDFPYIVYPGRIPEYITSYPRHWHEEAELIYVTGGQLRVTVWSEAFSPRSGDIVIVLPHAIHSIEQIGSERAEYYNIVFDFSIFGKDAGYDKYLKPFLTHEKKVNCYEPKGSPLNDQLKPLLLSLIEHRQNSYTTHEYLIKSHLFMIMHLLNQHCVDAEDNELALRQTYEKLKKALYRVQLSYAQETSIQKAAAMCGFSESHFMKLFKELTGMSFTAYLINYRLELAATQLVETDLNIIEIAGNCGFRNHSYFTRAFVKKYGTTPIKYRNNRR